MAINIATLQTRALTALVFVAVMLLGMLYNEWSFIALFTLIHFGCWYEFIQLCKKIYGNRWPVYSIAGVGYITVPIAAMIYLRLFPASVPEHGSTALAVSLNPYLVPCAILFSLWINDTMAYLVGSVIGRTPFSKISPKKTWEGTIGGVILCIITIALAGSLIPLAKPLAVKHWIAIATICAVFGTAGDLLESKLKRMAGLKDSGRIMPGHGGFLDRFDSLLLATPVVWLYMVLFV